MSHLRSWSIFTALVLCSASLSYSQVQTQASCTFTLFKAPGLLGGVNDYRTTVGQSSSNPKLGFIRYSNGGVSYFSPPNASSTSFTGRNDGGVSVGFYTTQGSSIRKGFILHGSTFTSFSHPKGAGGTLLTGINKYNSTVGGYFDSANITHGFKRYSNGGLVSLNYPGASQGTTALDINDNGTVVGWFSGSNGSHGFLYHGGSWAQVDYPAGNPGNTQLVGISNSNVVIGSFQRLDTYISFLYANGVFKNIYAPNADSTNVTGISANGIISGNVALSDGSTKEFTATCK
jgi:probable HAF family extracellular repeat protein